MKRDHNFLFRELLVVLFLFYFLQYLLESELSHIIRYPVIVDAILFISIYIIYLWKYRKDSLLCFETMALPVIFLGIFFEDVIFPLSVGDFNYHTIGNEAVKLKSADLQMMGFLIFLIGCTRANKKHKMQTKNKDCIADNVNYNVFVNVVAVILLVLIIYDYRSGVFNSWFYYNNTDQIDFEDRNQGLGHLTCLLVALSVAEIVRLKNQGVSNFLSFLKKCNKLFLFEWAFVSILLFITGNRNEMLLVALPLIVSYSICINKISNKEFLLFGILGIVLMVIAGATRQDDAGVSFSSDTSFNLLSFTIDFAAVGFDCNYLVGYTDQHGPVLFASFPLQVLSGIPLFGPMIIKTFGITGAIASSTLTTEAAGTIAGMGTSLIGDLYYNGGTIWVLVYMFFLGYVMSYLYYNSKNSNIYFLMLYSYMVANSIYYIRSQWAFPLTIIEYSAIVLLLGELLFKKRNNIVKVNT